MVKTVFRQGRGARVKPNNERTHEEKYSGGAFRAGPDGTYGGTGARRRPERVLIAATRVTEAGIEARVLSGDAVIRQDLEAALEDIAMHARVGHAPWAYLAVQIDDFGGIDGCIRPLLRFRHFCPEVPVLLLSARAVADDLSQERLALCDITLKTPLDFKGWDKALSVARENNAAWRVRLRARAKEARRLRAERCRMSAGTRLYSTRFM